MAADSWEAYQEAYESLRERFYPTFEGRVTALQEKEYRLLIERLGTVTGFPQAYALIPELLEETRPEWAKLYEDLYLTVGKAFGRKLLKELKAYGLVAFETKAEAAAAYDRWQHSAYDWLDRDGGQRIVGIADTTRTRMQRLLAAGEKQGMGIDKMAAMVDDHLDKTLLPDIIPHRSEVIARTEVVHASNFATHQTARYAAAEEAFEKTWLAALDVRTRPSHMAAHGQRKDMEELFTVGGEQFEFPSDDQHGGTAGNIINCRCCTTYSPAPEAPPITDDQYVDEPTLWRTYEDAQKWCNKQEIYQNIVVDFKGCDPTVLRIVLPQFTDVMKQYPQVAADLRYIGTYLAHDPFGMTAFGSPFATAEVAHAALDGVFIGMNPFYWSDFAKMTQITHSSLATGFHPAMPFEKAMASWLIHEYGHQVFNYHVNHGAALAFTSVVGMDDFGLVSSTFQKWVAKKFKQARYISKYARAEPSEFFAETFSLAMLDPKSKSRLVKQLRRLLELSKVNAATWLSLDTSVGIRGNGYLFLSDTTSAEFQEASKLLAQLKREVGL